MDFLFFVIPAFAYKYYTSTEHIHAFQAMYFLSSFFNQFGPNAVTFLVAAEVYPTPIRATAHGISAAVGKLGALTAAVLYNYIPDETKFYVVPWFGLCGVILTVVFLPDTTGLDLKEQERRWQFIRAGREEDYHGVAVHRKHLSLWERWHGVGRYYDADLDYRQKIDDLRRDWVENQARKAEEQAGRWDGDGETEFDDGQLGSHVSDYFERTSASSTLGEKGTARNLSE